VTGARKMTRVGNVPSGAAEIEAEIAQAEADLRSALLAGQPTGVIRTRLSALHAGAARLAAEHAEAEAQRHADEAAAVAAAAETIANQAGGRIAARQPRPIPNLKESSPVQHAPAITAAARQVAEAATRASAAEAGLARAAEAEAAARGRLDALASKRAAIVSRRQGGDAHDDDGEVLALAAADAEGMAPLLVEAQAATGAARAEAAEAGRLLAVARDSLTHAEAEVEIAAVIAHLGALDVALVSGLGRLHELQGVLHRSDQPYVPTPMLALALRKLLAQAGRL